MGDMDMGDLMFGPFKDTFMGTSDPGGLKGYAQNYTPGQTQALNSLLASIMGQTTGQPVNLGGQTTGGGESGVSGAIAKALGMGQNQNNMATGGVFGGVPAYSGQIAAGQSPLQSQIFGMLQGLLGTGGNAVNSLLQDFDPASTMDYWNKAVKDPAMSTWQNEILPQIKESFIGSGRGRGSGSDLAIAESGRRLDTDITSQLASLLFSGEQQSKQNQLSALTGMYTLGSLGLTAGATERGITNEQNQEGLNKWLYSQPYNNPWLQFLQTALGAQPRSPIIQQPYQTQGIMGDLIGAGGSMGAAMIGK